MSSFIVANNLKELYTIIEQKESYVLKTNNYELICSCYLEYSEYFLIFKDGIERYIRKSQVLELICHPISFFNTATCLFIVL